MIGDKDREQADDLVAAASPQPGGRLHETAQQAIKDYILRHALKPGGALPPEGKLARDLGISRTSVREAVKALESVGILEARAGVGLFVRSFSFDPIVENLVYSLVFDRHHLRELLAVRKQLEAGFIGEAATTLGAARMRVLRSAVERMGERVAQGLQAASPEEDRFFHRTIYAGLGNELLFKLLDVFWSVYQRLRDQAHVEQIDPVRTWENHRRIVEALEARDPAAARQAMLQHFEGFESRVRDQPPDMGDAGTGPGEPALPGAAEPDGPASLGASVIRSA